MSHTPKPWFHRSIEGGWDGVTDSSGSVICKISENNPENATLIAAAPELLEALEDLVASKKPGYTGHPITAMRFAEEAISKAKGEA